MSLLSPDRLTLLLAPDAVQALHTRGWVRRIAALRRLPLHEAAPGDWSGHLDACATLLAQYQPKSLHVVLSDRLLRYLVLPWNPQVNGAQEEMALAHIAFEDTYGEQSAGEWTFTISHEKPGVNRLVCAMPTVLLDGLRALTATGKARLQSVRPNLTALMQGQRRALGPQGWFIHMEGSRLTLLQWDTAGPRWVAAARCTADSLDSALSVLRREMLIAGAAPGADGAPVPVYLFNPTQTLTAVPVDGLQLELIGLSARTQGLLARMPADLPGPPGDAADYRAVLMGAQP